MFEEECVIETLVSLTYWKESCISSCSVAGCFFGLSLGLLCDSPLQTEFWVKLLKANGLKSSLREAKNLFCKILSSPVVGSKFEFIQD
jgi:hypothetical protein